MSLVTTLDISDLPTPPAWMLDALCTEVGPELFFGEGRGAGAGPAKRVCGMCPVITKCLEYALAFESGTTDGDHALPVGIYGGKSPRERMAILRRRADAHLEASGEDELTRACLLDGCGETFPATGRRRFCSEVHSNRVRGRRYDDRKRTA